MVDAHPGLLPLTTSVDRTIPARQGATLRHVAMPLGGVGAGHVAICGDGALRQWQLHNIPNHQGHIPNSFFAIRATVIEPPVDVIRLLQSSEVASLPTTGTPLVNDDLIPADQRELVRSFPGVARTTFAATYPTATIAYDDPALPVDVRMDASTPFVPLDAAASGLPVATFTFTVRNRADQGVHGALVGALQNAVGWDGITPFDGFRNPLLGGNTNTVRRGRGETALLMENHALPEEHPGAGQMVLSVPDENVLAFPQWTEPDQLRRIMAGMQVIRPRPGAERTWQRRYRNVADLPAGPSPSGTTWAGALAQPFWLAPGEERTFSFVMSWYFPNRYVNFDQFGPRHDFGHTRFWLGNDYAERHVDAIDVARRVMVDGDEAERTTREWVRLLRESTLSNELVETISAQGSLVRSPTTFRTADGNFFGFEGSLGASTVMWNGDVGGSCPLNCTHVWNYEMALSRLFPELERSMRTTDLDIVQAPDGAIPHRTILPLYLKQLWDVPVGGPEAPALDGMLGTVLKVCREMRQQADRPWLGQHWPKVRRLIDYIRATWDGDGDGVLDGQQGNTYDIHFYGPNPYIGGLWLATLLAGEYLAEVMGEREYASDLRDLFTRGSSRYDELLWNGEYYVQLLSEGESTDDQVGDGCLADQLFGQWWAHILGLGYILPQDHVRTALRSIVRYNTRRGFRDFDHPFRVFADGDDSGLLVCTWPRGNRPAVPVRYCDEVWTGIEYQVAAHCIMEGLESEGIGIVRDLRARYTGERRNPFNEIECGDHYARAMSGWSVLEALSGMRYDALAGSVRLVDAPGRSGSRLPFVTAGGWGELRQEADAGELIVGFDVRYGRLDLVRLHVDGVGAVIAAELDGRPLGAGSAEEEEARFPEPVTIGAGSVLTVRFRRL